MAGLDPAIHGPPLARSCTPWMPGSSPGMTAERRESLPPPANRSSIRAKSRPAEAHHADAAGGDDEGAGQRMGRRDLLEQHEATAPWPR